MSKSVRSCIIQFAALLAAFGLFTASAEAQKTKITKPGVGAVADPSGKSLAAKMLVPSLVKKATNCPALSLQPQVVGGPKGFFDGRRVVWDRCDDQVLLLLVVDSASEKGILIEGLEVGDQVVAGLADGDAYFSKNKGHPVLAGMVAVLAKGAELYSTAKGCPACGKIIAETDKFLEDRLNAKKGNPEKKRNAYGVDPGSGHKARQEGGIIICLPPKALAHSGNEDHEERWIQGKGDRIDRNVPDHAKHCFFPRDGDVASNYRKIRQKGVPTVVTVGTWDHIFEDNIGLYRIYLRLEKGGSRQTKPTELDRVN